MKPADDIKSLFKKSEITVGSDIDQHIMNDSLAVLLKKNNPHQHRQSRIMHGKIARLSGFAAVILVIIAITLITKATPKAWAIGQTIDAFKEIKTVQLKCSSPDSGSYDAFIRRTGQDWTTFQCLGENPDINFFGLLEGYLYYAYFPEVQAIYQHDISQECTSGSSAAKLYGEAIKMAPAVLPFAKTLFQTFKMLASEWDESYKLDVETGRDSVFVTCTYKPLSMSFEAIFDIETKLLVRAKAWNNAGYEGDPNLVIHAIAYNVEIADERFDFEERFGVPVIQYKDWIPASRLFQEGIALPDDKPQESIRVFQELYETYPWYWQTPEAVNIIGMLYKELKQYDKAIACHQKVLDEYEHPDWSRSDAWNMMGYCYREMNEPENAIRAFEHCLEMVQSRPAKPNCATQHSRYIQELKKNINELKASLTTTEDETSP